MKLVKIVLKSFDVLKSVLWIDKFNEIFLAKWNTSGIYNGRL